MKPWTNPSSPQDAAVAGDKHRRTSGSFVSDAREFMGERGSFVASRMSSLKRAMIGIYMKYWGTFADVPQWASL